MSRILERGYSHGLQGLWQEGEDPRERTEAQLLPERSRKGANPKGDPQGTRSRLPQSPRYTAQEHSRPHQVVVVDAMR